MDATGLVLEPARSALVIVDFQDRLFGAMPGGSRDGAASRVADLAFAARELDIPVVVTEQYPAGLGPTLAPIADELRGVQPIDKVDFSAWRVDRFRSALESLAGRSVVLVGMETHVCVYQTVRDLAAGGFSVHVPHDAVLSRTDDNRRVGLDLCRAAGATVTATESVVFDWLGRAGSDVFRAYSRRIR